MSDIQQLLGNEGAKHPYSAPDGREFQVSFLGQTVKAKFVAWLKARARKELAACGAEMTEARYRGTAAEVIDNLSSGSYDFGGRVCQKALKTPEGAAFFGSILFAVTPAEMLRLWAADPKGVKAVLDLAMAESAPPAKADAEGNASAPAG